MKKQNQFDFIAKSIESDPIDLRARSGYLWIRLTKASAMKDIHWLFFEAQ